MAAVRVRSIGAALPAVLCTVALGVTSMPAPALLAGGRQAVAQIETELRLLSGGGAGEGWVMGGTAISDPSANAYFGNVVSHYLQPSSPLFANQPTFAGVNFHSLTTPEQFCPIICLPGQPALNFGSSINAGVEQLNAQILPRLINGEQVTVLGYSQSATIASVEANTLIANAGKDGYPTLDQLHNLHLVLMADPNNPLGGILDRLHFPDGVQPFSLTPAPQHIPLLNVPLGLDATPTDHIPTDIYTAEYDGFGNFPRDLLNIPAVLNALLGVLTVHWVYPFYTADQLADTVTIGTIGDTAFHVIPQNLPILELLYMLGTPGQVVGDFLSPWLRLVIDWGYGNAGDPAVDGMYKIPGGFLINGSPYEQAIGVAGGPWGMTPLGELAAGHGGAGFFELMDPLQMLAGVQNAFVQSLVGPVADIVALFSGGTLTAPEISVINQVTDFLHVITGYDLVNAIDKTLVTGWHSMVDSLSASAAQGAGDAHDALLSGSLLPAEPLFGLLGLAFGALNFFGL